MAPKLIELIQHGRLDAKGKKDHNDDNHGNDDDENISPSSASSIKIRRPFTFPCIQQPQFPSTGFLFGLPDMAKLCFRSLAIATVTLYVLNQKHMLPMPMGRVVSKVLFWPTIPITISRRIGKWTTEVDDTVVIGGAPFGFMNYPDKLYKQFNVRGVVNMCDEYRGPISSYKRLGIEQLRLPTVDHFEPSIEDLKKAVDFIQKHESEGSRVYVHCRAGHGRSAAAVYAWLLYKEPLADPIDLNEKLCEMRNVRKSLWKQPNLNAFRKWLQSGGMASDSDSESYKPQSKRKQPASKRSRQNSMADLDNLGHVFSDEESTTDSDSAFDIYDDLSEDERDYEQWRKYNR